MKPISRAALVEHLERRELLSASLVKDIDLNNVAAQNPYGNMEITKSGGTVYFRADDGVHGPELWALPSGGSTPTMLKDIGLGLYNYSGGVETYAGPEQLTDVNGTLFFTEQDGASSFGLWKSNGTAATTVLVEDFAAGSGLPSLNNFTNVNGTLFFTAYSASNTIGLYKSNGTAAGTTLVHAFTGYSYPYGPEGDFSAFGSTLFFQVYAPSQVYQLWSSNGTDGGTSAATDSSGNAIGSSTITPVVTVNGVGYFGAGGLYQTDGTHAGTHRIYAGSVESNLIAVGGNLFFTAHDSNYYLSLFKTNLTTTTTTEVASFNSTNSGGTTASLLQPLGTGVVLYADGDSGTSLWYSDGTSAGTVRLAPHDSQAAQAGQTLVVSGNQAYFISSDGVHGDELWKTDGTLAGTVMVDDLRPGSVGGLANETLAGGVTTQDIFAAGNGTIYFSADDGTHGLELWQTNGTAAGTSQLAQINQNTLGANLGQGAYLNGLDIFPANDGVHGRQLWASNGMAGGTVALTNFNSGSPSNVTTVGNLVYFSQPISGGTQIWKTDGTAVGTVMVASINGGSGAFGFVAAAGKVFFTVASTQYLEYVTDGPQLAH